MKQPRQETAEMGMCNFYKTAIFIQSIQDENIDIDITVSEIFCVMTCELIQRLATHNMTSKSDQI